MLGDGVDVCDGDELSVDFYKDLSVLFLYGIHDATLADAEGDFFVQQCGAGVDEGGGGFQFSFQEGVEVLVKCFQPFDLRELCKL